MFLKKGATDIATGRSCRRRTMGKRKGRKAEGDLVDLVFSWRLGDVFNCNLYKDKVEQIPETFPDIEQYLESFTFPLLEETRADFCSALEVLPHAPISEIKTIAESIRCGGGLEYEIKMYYGRENPCFNGNETYIPSVGDIFVFSDTCPVSVTDLNRFGKPHIIALVTGCEGEESLESPDSNPEWFNIRTSKFVDVQEYSRRRDLFAAFLLNITTNSRIWKALNFEVCMLRNSSIISEVLYSDSQATKGCDLCSYSENGYGSSCIQSLNLNESQIRAILSSISASQCHHKHLVKLIWGPPGTGKTKTVATLLWALQKLNCSTIACAPTNVAIKEVARRLVLLIRETCQQKICLLGDVVLFGNKKRMKVEGDLLDIFLDYRAEKLLDCFVPLTGWNHRLMSMIDFFKRCTHRYKMYLAKVEIEEKNDEGIDEPLMFGQFVREQFSTIAKELKYCIRILLIHLPTPYISSFFEDMITLLRLFDLFASMLFSDNVTDEDLEELFMESGANSDASFLLENTDTGRSFDCSKISLMHKIRSECLKILVTLRDTLTIPSLTAKSSIREFCLSNASLFFCTASGSSKLHSIETRNPPELLVIDEAAQLKECESLIPLQLQSIQNAILIGDECQLPAMVRSKVLEKTGFGRSLFERLSLLGHDKCLLNVQYRMHPSISIFPNSNFYSGQILDAPNVKDKSYEKHFLQGKMYGSYSFINIPFGKEGFDGYSRKNMIEVAAVSHIVRTLSKASVAERQRLSVGIISPYTAQVVAIQKELGNGYKSCSNFVVNVKSVDGFQGGEEDIIIISTVRSNGNGSIGFLSNRQRANVALTRAKYCLWILGNGVTLANSGSIWKKLVLDAKNRECFFDVNEDRHLAEAILPAIIDLGQLNGLFNKDSLLFESSKWKVFFTEYFKESFERINLAKSQKEVVDVLVKLSNGWRPKERNIEFVYGCSFQLMQHCKVQRWYLIWSVEISKLSNYTQVMKFWDILRLGEVPKLVMHLNKVFSQYSEDYISHCKLKSFEGKLEVPVSWEVPPGAFESSDCSKTEPEDDLSSHVACSKTEPEDEN